LIFSNKKEKSTKKTPTETTNEKTSMQENVETDKSKETTSTEGVQEKPPSAASPAVDKETSLLDELKITDSIDKTSHDTLTDSKKEPTNIDDVGFTDAMFDKKDKPSEKLLGKTKKTKPK